MTDGPEIGTARPHRRRVPWPAIVAGKVVLARLPVSASRWRALGVFRHGDMDQAPYARRVFQRHVGRALPLRPGWTACELGPGDSAFTAVLAAAAGARRTYLVDAGATPVADPAPYVSLADELRGEGLDAPDLRGCRDLDEVLDRCHATYEQGGFAALSAIGDGEVDLCWSHAVLEHVRRAELDHTLSELARITSPTGLHSHRVDLRDHLGGGLENLRFPDAVWESRLMSGSGFYTNRVRLDGFLAAFTRAGFSPQLVRIDRWEEPPLARRALAAPFRELSDDDLQVSGFDVVLRRSSRQPLAGTSPGGSSS